MSELIKAGDMMIVDHPVMRDDFVLAKAAADQTAASVMLDYWYSWRGEWRGQPCRRKISTANVRRLPADADPTFVVRALEEARRAYVQRTKESMAVFQADIAAICHPTPDREAGR